MRTVRRPLSGRWWRGVLTRDHVRLGIAGGLCLLASLAHGLWQARRDEQDTLLGLNVTWLAFGIAYLALTAVAFARTSPETTRAWAGHQRRTRRPWYVRWFVGEARGTTFVVSVTLFAVIAAILLTRSDGAGTVELVLGAAGVVVSWILIQTAYTLLYADAFHSGRGLELPDEPEPDMLDFAYLAFTIGTTFAVIDARITDRRLRRVVLGHSLISFAFNTVLLGLVVSFLAR